MAENRDLPPIGASDALELTGSDEHNNEDEDEEEEDEDEEEEEQEEQDEDREERSSADPANPNDSASRSGTDSAGLTPGAGSKKNKKQHKCNSCDKSFRHLNELKAHDEVAHRGVRFSCKACQKSYTRKHHLDTHIATAHENITFDCDRCGRKFTRKSDRKRHIKSAHEDVKFKCAQCPEEFPNERVLKSHVQKVHIKKRFPCHICEKSFTYKGSLIQHLRNATTHGSALACKVCRSHFHTQADLDKHSQVHFVTKRFLCKNCTKSFRDMATLNAHMREAHIGDGKPGAGQQPLFPAQPQAYDPAFDRSGVALVHGDERLAQRYPMTKSALPYGFRQDGSLHGDADAGVSLEIGAMRNDGSMPMGPSAMAHHHQQQQPQGAQGHPHHQLQHQPYPHHAHPSQAPPPPQHHHHAQHHHTQHHLHPQVAHHPQHHHPHVQHPHMQHPHVQHPQMQHHHVQHPHYKDIMPEEMQHVMMEPRVQMPMQYLVPQAAGHPLHGQAMSQFGYAPYHTTPSMWPAAEPHPSKRQRAI
mmetsp:Transcript_10300/g.32805  ORF Transcript_10300/g.32805 Transcript_10300/m.32805 type:complete len:529 (+) Transcript_10300:153-1739(+)